MVQISRYPLNADGTPMDLMVARLVDATGNGGARLTNPPVGPDRAPIDTVGLVIVDDTGAVVPIGGAAQDEVTENITLGTTGYENLNALFAYLQGKRIPNPITVNIPAGFYDQTGLVTINHPDAYNLSFTGATAAINIVSVDTITSTGAFNHSVPLNLTSAAGISVGQFIHIRHGAIVPSISSAENLKTSAWLQGCWRVTAVAGNVVTIRVTDRRTTLPAPTVSNVTAYAQKSVLRWNSTTSGGIVVTGTTTGMWLNVIFDGQYDVANGLVDSNTDGIVIATSGAPTAGGNPEHQVGLGTMTIRYCGAVRWRSNGVYVNQAGTLEGAYSAFCSNGYRGLQAVGSGAAVYAKFAVCNGNRGSGAQYEYGGFLNLANCALCGNGYTGLGGAATGSAVIGGDTFIVGNDIRGVEVKDGGLVYAELAVFRNNADNDVLAYGPGSIVCVEACNMSGAGTAAMQRSGGGIIYHRGTPPTVVGTRWEQNIYVQNTSKSQTVTGVNDQDFTIRTHAEGMAAGDSKYFTVQHSHVNPYSVIQLSMRTASSGYIFEVDGIDEGTFRIRIFRQAGAGTEALALDINGKVLN